MTAPAGKKSICVLFSIFIAVPPNKRGLFLKSMVIWTRNQLTNALFWGYIYIISFPFRNLNSNCANLLFFNFFLFMQCKLCCCIASSKQFASEIQKCYAEKLSHEFRGRFIFSWRQLIAFILDPSPVGFCTGESEIPLHSFHLENGKFRIFSDTVSAASNSSRLLHFLAFPFHLKCFALIKMGYEWEGD